MREQEWGGGGLDMSICGLQVGAISVRGRLWGDIRVYGRLWGDISVHGRLWGAHSHVWKAVCRGHESVRRTVSGGVSVHREL